MSEWVLFAREQLAALANGKRAESTRNFFKEEIKVYGIEVPAVRRIARNILKDRKEATKQEIFEDCELLLQSGYFEESIIACVWSYSRLKQYTASDFKTFDRWVSRYISNWASCDTLCNHTVGEFLMAFPQHLPGLLTWCLSDNRWKRRAAAVSLIVPAKKGLFPGTVFEIAEALLSDPDDMVQKGYGWMLKSAAAADEAAVFSFIINNKHKMPRTALRYAIEKMPDELKQQAMQR